MQCCYCNNKWEHPAALSCCFIIMIETSRPKMFHLHQNKHSKASETSAQTSWRQSRVFFQVWIHPLTVDGMKYQFISLSIRESSDQTRRNGLKANKAACGDGFPSAGHKLKPMRRSLSWRGSNLYLVPADLHVKDGRAPSLYVIYQSKQSLRIRRIRLS